MQPAASSEGLQGGVESSGRKKGEVSFYYLPFCAIGFYLVLKKNTVISKEKDKRPVKGETERDREGPRKSSGCLADRGSLRRNLPRESGETARRRKTGEPVWSRHCGWE